MRSITIINQSTIVRDEDFSAAVAALQKQLDEHVAPLWGGLTAKLTGQKADPTAPQTPNGETIYILDDSDQVGALGYHELSPHDQPIGFCFAKTCLQDNTSWQSCLSHELIEELIDPYADTCVEVASLPSLWRGRNFRGPAVVAYEACDPVENDSYPIDGVPVSNFVTPRWFQSQDTPGVSGPYDFLQKLSAPLTMTPGGYIAYSRNLRNWAQLTDRKEKRVKKYRRHGKKERV